MNGTFLYKFLNIKTKFCPVGWGCRIHRLHLCRGVRPPPQSDGEVPMILIGKNTEKSPGDLRKLSVTQIPVKDHQLTLAWKTCKEYNSININQKPKGLLFSGTLLSKLILCRGVRPPPPISVLDMTLNNLMVRFQ